MKFKLTVCAIVAITTAVVIPLGLGAYLVKIDSPYALEYLDTIESIAKYVFDPSIDINITLQK
ncbi:hypothetical protein [Vibrio sp. 16]|uniref:hypothetical protein n=1 Tax=Vibrio sp. 16 TaxID=391586 RepID=UPI0005C46D48|nr:hypothetical protein [Vibrio sp. 16]CAK4074149.1 hypothetical protein VDT1_3239 [Vibrio sp. 16]